MVNKAWHLALVGALAVVVLVTVGAMVLNARKPTLVGENQPFGPQASAQLRHAQLAAEGRSAAFKLVVRARRP
jgi:hypothetical protein